MRFHWVISLFFLSSVCFGVNADRSRKENLACVETTYQEQLKQTETNIMVRSGLLADRSTKTVEILAESTGVTSNEPIEFLLIGLESGHDYEALAVSFAKPRDIQKALEFIGVPRGQPVDYEALRMWPRGERVSVEFALYNGSSATEWIRGEDLLLGADEKTLPPVNFVFTGIARSENDTDTSGPHSILSLYNEPLSVLDVPRMAPQNEIYGDITIHPEYLMTTGQLLRVRFRPVNLAEGSRSVDLVLHPKRVEKALLFSLSDTNNQTLLSQADLNRLLSYFSVLQKEERDIYLTVLPSHELSLDELKNLYAFFESINKDKGIRLTPPATGEIYYQSFLPNVSFRKREKRPTQPWELHLGRATDGSVTGELVHIEEVWQEGQENLDYQTDSCAVTKPAELAEGMGRHPDTLKVMLIFAPPDLTYGKLLNWYNALQSEISVVYFFVKEPK